MPLKNFFYSLKNKVYGTPIYHLYTSFFLLRFFKARLNFNFYKYKYELNESSNAQPLSRKILLELINSVKNDIEKPSSIWKGIFEKYHSEFLFLIKNKDIKKISDILINPTENNLMYGFDNMSKALQSKLRLETLQENIILSDHFLALSEYLEINRVNNPESLSTIFKKKLNITPLIEEIAETLFHNNKNIFQNPLNGEKGINTKYGIVSLRVPNSIYQSIIALSFGKNICEIGPGLGRAAYFSTLLGATKYTLVDIPISSIVQGHYLIQCFNRSDVCLNNEKYKDQKFQLMLPSSFFSSENIYDLVINVDSLTEIDKGTAKKYLNKITKNSKYFLSINHEANAFTISSLTKEVTNLKRIYRKRSWIRKGYIEELFEVI